MNGQEGFVNKVGDVGFRRLAGLKMWLRFLSLTREGDSSSYATPETVPTLVPKRAVKQQRYLWTRESVTKMNLWFVSNPVL